MSTAELAIFMIPFVLNSAKLLKSALPAYFSAIYLHITTHFVQFWRAFENSITQIQFYTPLYTFMYVAQEDHSTNYQQKQPDGTYFFNIENKDTGRMPFLYNDIKYSDDITNQAASVGEANGYIWKVVTDGTNITSIVNAETGKGIKATGKCTGRGGVTL